MLTRNNVEEAGSEPPEGVRDALGDHSGEGALLERRDVVAGGAADGGQLAEALGKANNRRLHLGGPKWHNLIDIKILVALLLFDGLFAVIEQS